MVEVLETEIMHRAKTIKTGKWVYGYYVKANENTHFIVQMNYYCQLLRNVTYEIDPATLAMSIRFKGVLIWASFEYEKDKLSNGGDRVKFYEDDALPEMIGVVEYEKNKAAFWIHNRTTEEAFYLYDATKDSSIEIIGPACDLEGK